jgi:hypothetical protein
MFPHFSRLMDHAPAATFMLVRSGTSRLVVLDGSQIRPGAQGHKEVLSIMLGSDRHGGLGGATLQDNKVVLVWPEAELARFRFRFLQVVPSSGVVLPMECSNSSSASAMLAQLGGHHLGAESQWRAVNLSTGQKIELRPNSDHEIARAWVVRFLATSRTRKAMAGLTGDHRVKVRGEAITFRPVLLGNLFLFARIDPDRVDLETVGAIARAGMHVARKAGFHPKRGYEPKVIPYTILSTGAQPQVRTASYYHGERHRSFPGSAAMAITAFLTGMETGVRRIRTHWRVHHPSGVIEVDLGFDTSRHVPKLLWTEFVTPVSLLGWGAVAIPWRRGD